MNVPFEAPSLSGHFSSPNHSAPDSQGSNDLTSELAFRGDWRPEDFRSATHPRGSVAIYGDCTATQPEIEDKLARALTNGDPGVLATLPGSYTAMLSGPDGEKT